MDWAVIFYCRVAVTLRSSKVNKKLKHTITPTWHEGSYEVAVMQVEIKPCHVKMFPYYTSGKYQETYG